METEQLKIDFEDKLEPLRKSKVKTVKDLIKEYDRYTHKIWDEDHRLREALELSTEALNEISDTMENYQKEAANG